MFGRKPARSNNKRKHSTACGFINLQQTEILKATLEPGRTTLDELARLKEEG